MSKDNLPEKISKYVLLAFWSASLVLMASPLVAAHKAYLVAAVVTFFAALYALSRREEDVLESSFKRYGNSIQGPKRGIPLHSFMAVSLIIGFYWPLIFVLAIVDIFTKDSQD